MTNPKPAFTDAELIEHFVKENGREPSRGELSQDREYHEKYGKYKRTPSKVQVGNREAAVFNWLVSGYSYSETMRYCATMFAIKQRTVDKYLSKARDEVARVSQHGRARLRNLTIARATKILNNSMIKKRYGDALKANDQIAKLNNLYTLTEKELNESLDNGETPAKLDPSRLTKEERDLFIKLQRKMIVEDENNLN